MKPAREPALFARLGSAQALLRRVRSVEQAVAKLQRDERRVLRLDGLERQTLRMVARLPGISAGDLASMVGEHPSTLTRTLDRLERRGLLLRKRDPRDRRRAQLGLTAAGRTLDGKLPEPVQRAAERALAPVSRARVDQTIELLGRIAEALEAELAPPTA